MRLQRRVFFLVAYSFFWLLPMSQGVGADGGAPALSLDLTRALERALEDNPALQAKRQALGVARGRMQQAELLFQDNPRLSVDADYRHRRFALPTGKSGADTEVRLLQEIEIAGQRGHRREAAAKNLAQAEWSVADAERLLRWEVTQVFYDLLAAQEKVVAQQQVVTTQETLLQAGLRRFDRGDISALELDTLRLDRDRARNDLVQRENEKVLAEQQLRSFLGLGGETSLVVVGNLLDLSPEQARRSRLPSLEELEACALETRPDLKAAHFNLEVREAELRLAQARRIPNISLGPLYKLDNEDQVIGGTIAIPLPLFNRNQQEITTALANLEVARTELEARRLAARQEVASAYTRVRLAEERLAPYGKTYLDNLTQSAAFTRRAYEAGEITIFEFSVALDRLVQTRFRYLDAILVSLQATAELGARAAFCPAGAEPDHSRP
jgi:cobalt-zinc-cadmium efflux system outer membrane protein